MILVRIVHCQKNQRQEFALVIRIYHSNCNSLQVGNQHENTGARFDGSTMYRRQFSKFSLPKFIVGPENYTKSCHDSIVVNFTSICSF